MDPKKIVILVVLVALFVFVGKWACKKWEYYHPAPPTMEQIYGYRGGKGPGPLPGAPGAPAGTPQKSPGAAATP